MAPLAVATLVLAIGGLATYVAMFGDPQGGMPRVEVPIAREAPAAPRLADAPSTGSRERLDAAAVEQGSGVSITRPAGTAPPSGIVIRVPDSVSGPARAADSRLLETSRFGPLPRIAPDGLRPLEAYRRPPPDGQDGATRRIAIVIGGLGISAAATQEAISKLPPAVSLAFAPYGSDLDGAALRAREAGHEILLQIPMEPFDYPDSDPGPHTLLAAARPAENLDHLHWAMGRLTGYVALMNYMGGKLTAEDKALAPLLREAGARGLGFVDDGSSLRSRVLALGGGTPTARSEVVLDGVSRPDAIDKALERLEAAAGAGAVAVGSASALPVTIERIARWAKAAEARGIVLVPVSAALLQPKRDNAIR